MTPATTDNEPNQSDTFTNMSPGSLYILLYRDHDPHVRFHWGLYHYLNKIAGGWKFDIIRPTGRWQTSIPYTSAPSPSNFDDTYADGPLACAIRLCHIDSTYVPAHRQVHELITAEDSQLNELNATLDGQLSCRVYVQRACERLRLQGYIDYFQWEDVQREVLGIGDQSRGNAGKRPVLVVHSNVAIPSSL